MLRLATAMDSFGGPIPSIREVFVDLTEEDDDTLLASPILVGDDDATTPYSLTDVIKPIELKSEPYQFSANRQPMVRIPSPQLEQLKDIDNLFNEDTTTTDLIDRLSPENARDHINVSTPSHTTKATPSADLSYQGSSSSNKTIFDCDELYELYYKNSSPAYREILDIIREQRNVIKEDLNRLLKPKVANTKNNDTLKISNVTVSSSVAAEIIEINDKSSNNPLELNETQSENGNPVIEFEKRLKRNNTTISLAKKRPLEKSPIYKPKFDCTPNLNSQNQLTTGKEKDHLTSCTLTKSGLRKEKDTPKLKKRVSFGFHVNSVDNSQEVVKTIPISLEQTSTQSNDTSFPSCSKKQKLDDKFSKVPRKKKNANVTGKVGGSQKATKALKINAKDPKQTVKLITLDEPGNSSQPSYTNLQNKISHTKAATEEVPKQTLSTPRKPTKSTAQKKPTKATKPNSREKKANDSKQIVKSITLDTPANSSRPSCSNLQNKNQPTRNKATKSRVQDKATKATKSKVQKKPTKATKPNLNNHVEHVSTSLNESVNFSKNVGQTVNQPMQRLLSDSLLTPGFNLSPSALGFRQLLSLGPELSSSIILGMFAQQRGAYYRPSPYIQMLEAAVLSQVANQTQLGRMRTPANGLDQINRPLGNMLPLNNDALQPFAPDFNQRLPTTSYLPTFTGWRG